VDWSTLLGIGIWPKEQFWFLYAVLVCPVAAAFVSRALLLPVAAALYLASYFLPAGIGVTAGAHFAIVFAVGVVFSAKLSDWNLGWSWLLCWIPFAILGTFAWRIEPNYFSGLASSSTWDGSHVWRLVHGGERVGNDAVESHDVTVQRP